MQKIFYELFWHKWLMPFLIFYGVRADSIVQFLTEITCNYLRGVVWAKLAFGDGLCIWTDWWFGF